MTLCDECDMAPYLDTPCQIRNENDLLPLLSLDPAPDSSNTSKKFSVSPSIIILSRVCVNYLSSKATFDDWSICVGHKSQLLDTWSPPDTCCHHQHLDTDHETGVTMGSVTYAMSKTILKSDGMVLPIGGRVCKTCKDGYIRQYIPALTSIKDIKQIPSTKETPAPVLSSSTPVKSASTPALSPDDIQRRLSSLTPVLPETRSEPVAEPLSPTSATSSSTLARVSGGERESVTSDTSSDFSITVKEELIIEAGQDDIDMESLDTTEDDQPEPEPQPEPELTNAKKTSEEDEYKYYCKLCHIGFLKESSYKYHLANNLEEHNKMKNQKNKVKKCGECGKSFKGDHQFRKHLYKEHKVGDPHYCKLCNIVLKSESAYRSHYSKLHLERRTKIFYCRECGDIFNCKVDHQEHIHTHWLQLDDESGSQCITCGKVFGPGNRNAYIKHLATHDDESQKPCDCPKCDDVPEAKQDKKETKSPRKRRSSPRGSPRKTKNPKLDLLDEITKSFDESLRSKEDAVDDIDTEEEDPVDAALKVTCGVCGNTFNKIEDLETHIESVHSNKQKVSQSKPKLFAARAGGWKCNMCGDVLRTSRDLKQHKSKKECPELRSNLVNNVEETTKENSKPSPRDSKINFNSSWQQSDSRNWAAEFGYKESSGVGQQHKDKLKPKDILSAMKLNFGKAGDESSDEEEDEEDEGYVPGMKESKNHKINREPRTLSEASRQTRKRLELLTRQAQEKMKARDQARAVKHNQAPDKNSRTSVNNNQVASTTEASSEDEDLNADINNKDDLLIPLANGWVCEKTREKDSSRYTTLYWSPEGENFKSLTEIKKHSDKHKLNLDMQPFSAANIDMDSGDSTAPVSTSATSVRVKDEETGLPMVIIFPGGSDCLTMDVSATAS